MQKEEVINYIVKELGKHHNPKDIALALCEQSNMPWVEAQKLVRQVQSSHRQEIAERRNPTLIILSIGLLLLGLAFLCIGVWILSQGVVNRVSLMASVIGGAMFLGGVRGLWNIIVTFLKENKL